MQPFVAKLFKTMVKQKMPTNELVKKLHELAGHDPGAPQLGVGDVPGRALADDDESLIGFFQSFRPKGEGLDGAFDEISSGRQLIDRLKLLYDAAGDDRRPQGGRDAYFVVRNANPITPDRAESAMNQWLTRIGELALSLGDISTVEALQRGPSIRVLEGIPPKHPKRKEEKSELLKTFESEVATLTARIDTADPHAKVLRKAYYFIACDAMLRDFLMWPLYADASSVDEPFAPYFELWRHGVKYRIFGDSQIDLYLPRSS